MDIVVRGKHFDVPERVDDRCREKLAKLDRYLPALQDAAVEVDISHEKAKQPEQRFHVHVTMSAHGIHLQAAEHAEQPDTAVDQAVRVLTRQARKQKDRLYTRGRSRAAKEVIGEAIVEEEAAEPDERIARVKHLTIKPMTIGEALDEAQGLKHDFFVFFHAELEQYAVLYRRRAGDYGLIVPELS